MRLEIRPGKRRMGRGRRGKRALVFLFVLALICAAFLLFGKTSEMIREVAQSELESIAYDIVGDTVQEELSSGEFSDLIHIRYDNNNRISAIECDTEKLNTLKFNISRSLSKIMMLRHDDRIYIPIGNLTGIDFLAGLGPSLAFDIHWVSSVGDGFRTEFSSAGINQTNYRVFLDFSINVGMMLAGREVGCDVGTSVCVAETVIVGEIPKYFNGK